MSQKPPTTLLLSSFHDPEARLLPLVRRLTAPGDPLADAWCRARENYAGAVAIYSPATDERSLRAIQAAGWEIVTGITAPDRGLWDMVRIGLERPVERIHFCDLDRLVHWLIHYPDELIALAQTWERNDVTMLARSLRAFASHPLCQTLTEGLANLVLADRLKLETVDAYSGSYVWSRRAAQAIVEAPAPRDLRFYTEGVMAPFRAGCSLGSVVVEGLEWETPDQYPTEIAELGYSGWLSRFESADQWRLRVEMARVFVEAALTP